MNKRIKLVGGCIFEPNKPYYCLCTICKVAQDQGWICCKAIESGLQNLKCTNCQKCKCKDFELSTD